MMTNNELGRIEGLEARVIALQLVVRQLVRDAPEQTKDAIAKSVDLVGERAMAQSWTDRQIDLIQQSLRSMR